MGQTYASLTTQQQQQLASNMDAIFRPIAGEFAQLVNRLAPLVTMYNQNGTAAILALLNSSEVIPNSTNLAGSDPLNAFQWGLWFNLLSAASTGVLVNANTDTMQGVYGMMAGPTNCVG